MVTRNTKMQQELKKEGLPASALDYFNTEENTNEISDALQYVFFMAAARQNPSDARVRMVRQAQGNLPVGASIDRLQKDNPTAYRAYMELVGQGMALSLNNSETVGTFLRRGGGLHLCVDSGRARRCRGGVLRRRRGAIGHVVGVGLLGAMRCGGALRLRLFSCARLFCALLRHQ